MKTTVKRRVKSAPRKPVRTARRSAKTSNAAVIIRQMGNDWARHWNAGILDKVAAAYAPDAVYLPPQDGTKKEDQGEYLTVWKWADAKWLIAADAWSSNLPASPLIKTNNFLLCGKRSTRQSIVVSKCPSPIATWLSTMFAPRPPAQVLFRHTRFQSRPS
jgi:hypothetical protein